MKTKSTETKVKFSHSFRLASFDKPKPPGTYTLVVDEEQLEGLSFVAFHRTAATIYAPAAGHTGSQQAFPTTPEELEAALEADALASSRESDDPRSQPGGRA